MITIFEEWCKKKNIDIIELTVCSQNNNSYNLYKRNGFDIIKHIMYKEI